MSKFYIHTLGCRLNQAESQELKQSLLASGWQETGKTTHADLLVLNTCVVTKKAERETRKAIRRLRAENPQAKLVVAGCWVDKINRVSGLDVAGIDQRIRNKQKWNLAESLKQKAKSQKNKFEYFSRRALIRVQTGCSNGCAYCLPYLIRGRPKTVPAEAVVDKVDQALNDGAIEIVLTGQNISQYQDKDKNWLDLVEKILKQTEVKLLRLGSINPLLVETGDLDYKQAADRLVGLYNDVGKNRLARHLHLSLQSGSDKVLKRMNRNYTSKEFQELVNIVRRGVKGINITTDIIVGFPGETKKDFKKTLKFIKKLKFGKLHIFRYSARKGTLAYKKAEQWGKIDSRVKKERSRRVRKLGKRLKKKFWQNQIGKQAIAKVWGESQGLTDNYIPIKLNLGQKLSKPRIEKIKLITSAANFVQARILE